MKKKLDEVLAESTPLPFRGGYFVGAGEQIRGRRERTHAVEFTIAEDDDAVLLYGPFVQFAPKEYRDRAGATCALLAHAANVLPGLVDAAKSAVRDMELYHAPEASVAVLKAFIERAEEVEVPE